MTGSASDRLPAKADFAPMDLAYLDSATMHPLSLAAKSSVESYLAARTFAGSGYGYYAGDTEKRVLRSFAALVNASPREVCFVPNTTAAEHSILAALEVNKPGCRIVVDTLHFSGSFYLYHELLKRGTDVVWVASHEGRILTDDLEKAVIPGTKLVVCSVVSAINGFQHDLRKVCEIAHASGAYVYADIAHAAGCVPIDVRASDVDFAACPSFKWLMGDFGLGFLYVRESLLERLTRTQFGYYQLQAWRTPAFPFDQPSASQIDYTATPDATGLFATGTLAHTVLAQLDCSLEYLHSLGVPAIESYRQPLLRRLKSELPRLGYRLLSPPESTGPLITFECEDATATGARLMTARVKIALHQKRMRISPSVFNDQRDIDRLLEALS